MPAVLAVSIALAGCLGDGTGDANDDVMDPAGGSDDRPIVWGGGDSTLTYEPIATIRVNFPLGPADPAPAGPSVDVPDNTAALKFDVSWHSTTGNLIWSSAAPPAPATELLRIRLDWSEGDHAATLELAAWLHVSVLPTPGDAFMRQTETLPLDPARGGTLDFSPTGWGDVWAIIEVSAGHA